MCYLPPNKKSRSLSVDRKARNIDRQTPTRYTLGLRGDTRLYVL